MQSHLHEAGPGKNYSQYPSKPFLKWAGGKQRLIAILSQLTPRGGRLIEPFVGAGCLSLATSFDRYLMNDANPDLIEVWLSLKYRPAEFIERASYYFRPEFWSEASYLLIREEFNLELDRFERAVRFTYLNRFGFNGMYRVNNSGRLNVPYGHPKKLPAFPFEAMESAALKMDRFDIRCGGYGHVLELAGQGDVVYCDPPYLSVNEAESSVSYTANKFGLVDFQSLVGACEVAGSRGARLVLSQVDNEESRRILRNWLLTSVEVRSTIAASTQMRRQRRELIARLI